MEIATCLSGSRAGEPSSSTSRAVSITGGFAIAGTVSSHSSPDPAIRTAETR